MRVLTVARVVGQVALAPAHVAVGVARNELAMRRRRLPVFYEPPVMAWFECVGGEIAAFLGRRG